MSKYYDFDDAADYNKTIPMDNEIMIFCPDVTELTKRQMSDILYYYGLVVIQYGIKIIENRKTNVKSARMLVMPVNNKGYDFFDKIVQKDNLFNLYYDDGDMELELKVTRNRSRDEIENYQKYKECNEYCDASHHSNEEDDK